MSGKRIPGFIFAATAVLILLASTSSLAGETYVARMEVISFPSTTLSDREFLNGQKEGKPVTVSGSLRLPSGGTNRLPVIILVHGSGGIAGYLTDWEQDLNQMGVATFIFDSFAPRGINNTRDNQAQLGRLAMIIDAYRALEVLARHPRIDPSRIVIMGFSRGGQATLYSSVKRFQRMHGPVGLEFAAYIPFYPDCMTTFKTDDEVADKPIRIFHGTADDWNPIARCREYVETLEGKGQRCGVD